MRYEDVKEMIERELSGNPNGLTWKQLKENLSLPYETFCPEWIKQLEQEIGLDRSQKQGRSLLWKLKC